MVTSVAILFELFSVVPSTLLIAAIIIAVSFFLGIGLALMTLFKKPIVYQLARTYISFFRGTPLLIQLFIMYYGLPNLVHYLTVRFNTGWHIAEINPIVTIIISYSLYYAAYQAETLRGAFNSVDKSQIELADSLGYNFWQTLCRITFPQAFKISIPNMFNTFLSVMKALSLGFTVTFVDIFAKAKLESAMNNQYLQTFALAAVVYWLICIVASVLFRKVEYYLRQKEMPDRMSVGSN
ncbi:MAG: amino acid ABC transporter permease [Sporolactobacillus sp.]|jgi:His/Glu/Gln/Arg/opine family amino acid ABC transporter permease subunit|nr:amino acid ABC transporter permease [Sporolactobacillus sp.]